MGLAIHIKSIMILRMGSIRPLLSIPLTIGALVASNRAGGFLLTFESHFFRKQIYIHIFNLWLNHHETELVHYVHQKKLILWKKQQQYGVLFLQF
ncbi:MAG: hypothetical protein K9G67_06705 [Bacteroidales bacterium]|nr:hypothetical protein [Bacteroidales bacterium]MCF8349588.1 hypothetical protein [Bacteroidales bacterium]MCF8376029.1 hypothetical protein [Bacteroidales bacterium]MCF8400438.1 hypothetical protein [Bacteroidales bacterium]